MGGIQRATAIAHMLAAAGLCWRAPRGVECRRLWCLVGRTLSRASWAEQVGTEYLGEGGVRVGAACSGRMSTTAQVRQWKASALAGLRPKIRAQVRRGDIVSSQKKERPWS